MTNNNLEHPKLNFIEDYSSIRTKSKTLDIEAFRIPKHGFFLATANQGRDRSMDSGIYKWKNGDFVLYQNITTDSAQDWEYFKIGDDVMQIEIKIIIVNMSTCLI